VSGTRPDAGADAPWPSAGRAWAAVAVLTFAYVVSFVDRQVLTLLVPAIKRDLLLSDTQISLLQGLAFGVFYTLLGLPLGLLADRGSRRGIIAAGAAVWSAMTAACGLAGTYLQLFLARVGVGVGEAALNPAALSMISDYFPAERRALPIGVYVSAGSLGGGMAMIIGGAVIAFAEGVGEVVVPALGTLRGWQLVFVLVALPGLLIPVLMALVREPARRGARLEAPPRWTDFVGFLKERSRLLALHLGGFAVFSMLVYGLISWTPTLFMRTHGWTAERTGLLYGLTFLVCGVAGAVAGGALASRWRRAGRTDAALRVTAIGATAIVPPSALAPLVPDPHLSLLLWGVSTFFVSFPSGASVAALQEVAPNELRAQA
jgi:MFS family permease